MGNNHAFFDEYERIFSGPVLRGALTSPEFPFVELRLVGSEQHEPGTCVEISALHADLAHRGQGREEVVLQWVQELATKQHLTVCVIPSDAQRDRYLEAKFVKCDHDIFSRLGYLEWPRCAHRL